MERRTTSRRVTIRHPFWLGGMELPQPAGTYTVNTEEEAPGKISAAGWRHVATTLQLLGYGAPELVCIDPQELRDVLARDGDQDIDPPATPSLAQAGVNRAASR